GLVDYQIADNRRSTNKIIDLLNHVRTSMRQDPVRGVEGTKPVLLVGNMNDAMKAAIEQSNSEMVTSLAWHNITSNAMKKALNSPLPTSDLLIELYNTDKNIERRRTVISCIKAIELAKQTRFKESIKEMQMNFKALVSPEKLSKTALMTISYLLSMYPNYENKPLLYFYSLS